MHESIEYVYDVVVKKVHVRYLISWWVSCSSYKPTQDERLVSRCLTLWRHRWAVSTELPITSIRQRVIFKTTIQEWKCIHGVVPRVSVGAVHNRGKCPRSPMATACIYNHLSRVQTSVAQRKFALLWARMCTEQFTILLPLARITCRFKWKLKSLF